MTPGQLRLGFQKLLDADIFRRAACHKFDPRPAMSPKRRVFPGPAAGTRWVMPIVALAPAQLCATRRTSSALPSRMAPRHLVKLLVGLLKIHLHQFAQVVEIAIRQILHALHVHRRFRPAPPAGPARGARFGFHAGSCRPSFPTFRGRPWAAPAWPDNHPCRRRCIFRGRPASHARSSPR